jgi:micrococcal nuclease
MRYFSKRNARIWISVLIALITLLFGTNAVQKSAPVSEKIIAEKSDPHIEANILYSVTHIVDGDTLNVDINGETKRIRLIGLNTPETVDPRRQVECFGKEASEKAKKILTGQKVRIETDPSQGSRDKYGRWLAYVFLHDGTLFNKLMIEEGYGHEYTYRLPYKYMEEFKVAETKARENKKGLWADGVCE